MTSNHLDNLLRIGLLDQVPFSAALQQKMLASAQNRFEDALRVGNSMETRFDCAYTAIRAVADAALLQHGYRTSTSKPGHHQTTLQCLVHTLGVDAMTVKVLDGLRKQRNLCDYDGDLVTQGMLDECLSQARVLLATATEKFEQKR